VFDFVATRIGTLKAALSRSSREVATFLVVTGLVTVLQGPGARFFPRARAGVEAESVQAGPLAERIGLVVGDTTENVEDALCRGGPVRLARAGTFR